MRTAAQPSPGRCPIHLCDLVLRSGGPGRSLKRICRPCMAEYQRDRRKRRRDRLASTAADGPSLRRLVASCGGWDSLLRLLPSEQIARLFARLQIAALKAEERAPRNRQADKMALDDSFFLEACAWFLRKAGATVRFPRRGRRA